MYNNFFNSFLMAFVPYGIVPINELYAWSNNQKIHILFHKIAELVQASNGYDKMFEEIQKLLIDFDDDVKEKVEELIQAMYDDGSLQEMIGRLIVDSIESKAGSIDLQHIGRVIRVAHNFKNYSTGNHDNSFNIEHFNYAQGNVVFDQDGHRYWAVAYVCNNGTNFKYSNNIQLVVYKFNAFGGLDYITHEEYGAIGHANGVGYCDGYIYITPNSEAYDTGGSNFVMRYSRKIFRIKFENEVLDQAPEAWEVEDIPTIDNFIDGVCGYDHKVYFFDGHGDVYSFDWDTHTSTKEFDNVMGDNSPPGIMSVTEDFLYFCEANVNRIYRYNKNLGGIDWTYQLPYKFNCNMYASGEIEGCTILPDGMLYILGCYDTQRVGCCYSICRFYRQSLNTNKLKPTSVLGWSSSYNTYNQSFIVAGDYPTDTDSPKNVTGLTDDSAFTSVPEAIEFINHSDWITHATIYIKQSQHCVPICIETNKSIVISSAYGVDLDHPPLIGMIYARNCPFLEIYNVGIRNLLPSNFAASLMTQSCFHIDGGNIKLTAPYMPTDSTYSNAPTVKYGIKITNCYLNLNQSNGIAQVVPADWESARSAQGIDSPLYMSASECSVNSHNLFPSNVIANNYNILR